MAISTHISEDSACLWNPNTFQSKRRVIVNHPERFGFLFATADVEDPDEGQCNHERERRRELHLATSTVFRKLANETIGMLAELTRW
jgi:hypothetical protein